MKKETYELLIYLGIIGITHLIVGFFEASYAVETIIMFVVLLLSFVFFKRMK